MLEEKGRSSKGNIGSGKGGLHIPAEGARHRMPGGILRRRRKTVIEVHNMDDGGDRRRRRSGKRLCGRSEATAACIFRHAGLPTRGGLCRTTRTAGSTSAFAFLAGASTLQRGDHPVEQEYRSDREEEWEPVSCQRLQHGHHHLKVHWNGVRVKSSPRGDGRRGARAA